MPLATSSSPPFVFKGCGTAKSEAEPLGEIYHPGISLIWRQESPIECAAILGWPRKPTEDAKTQHCRSLKPVFDGGVGSMSLVLTASRLKMGILACRLPLSDGSQQPYLEFRCPKQQQQQQRFGRRFLDNEPLSHLKAMTFHVIGSRRWPPYEPAGSSETHRAQILRAFLFGLDIASPSP